MKFFLIPFLAILATVIPFVQGIPTTSLQPRDDAASDIDLAPIGEGYRVALLYLFSSIQIIPDSVLEAGDLELDAWLVEHGYRAESLYNTTSSEEKRSLQQLGVSLDAGGLDPRGLDIAKAIDCGIAISHLIASTIIPAIKLIHIKKLIDVLRGVIRVVEMLTKANNQKDLMRLGGKELVELVLELTGIESIKEKCF